MKNRPKIKAFLFLNRRKLETNNVSLENVIIKESESTVVGTVKVKNLSFHKEVFIRSTWDNWTTQTDTFCTYSQIVGASGAYVIYDTFSFKLTLPPHSRNLEFCVCYKADDKEYWDSNGVSQDDYGNDGSWLIVMTFLGSQLQTYQPHFRQTTGKRACDKT